MLQARQLDAFRAVMLTGGMTSAADMIHISQPAVSRLIGSLEDHIGFQLFERVGNRLKPTAEAMILFKEVSRYYDGVERIAKAAEDLRNSRVGSLRVASFNALSLSFMSDVLQRFLADRPEVSVYLETEASRTILELVSLHHYDIGIVQISGDYPGLDIEPLPILYAECILPASHRLTEKDAIEAADLEGEPFISLGKNSPLRIQTDAMFAASGVRCIHRIEASLAASACDLVSKGLGISLIDPFTANFYGTRNICRKPFTPAVPYHFAIALPSGKIPTILVSEFRTLLREAFIGA